MAGRVLKAFVFFTVSFVFVKGALSTHMYIITVTEFESRMEQFTIGFDMRLISQPLVMSMVLEKYQIVQMVSQL